MSGRERKKISTGIKDLKGILEGVVKAGEAIERGDRLKPVREPEISFTSFEASRKALTPKRSSTKEAARSATAAASPSAHSIVEPVKDLSRIKRYFRERAEVSALYLFGSFSKERTSAESDIDIAVLIDESQLKRKNFEVLKNRYYAASPSFSLRPVDIVILNTAPTFLKYQVLKTGKVLFDRKRKLRVQFTERAITEYLDFKPVEDIYLNAVAGRFRRANNGR